MDEYNELAEQVRRKPVLPPFPLHPVTVEDIRRAVETAREMARNRATGPQDESVGDPAGNPDDAGA